MAESPHTGQYDALEPRAPSPHHDPSLAQTRSSDSMNIPPEDLDFDPPPGAARPRFYNSEFGGPQPRQSYADSFDASSTRVHSENPSFAAFPVDPRVSGYAHSSLYQQYRDDPSQDHPMSSLGRQRDLSPAGIMEEKRAMYSDAGKRRRRTWLTLGGIALLVLIIGAVLGIYFGVIRPHQNHVNNSNNNSGSSSTSNGSGSPSGDSQNRAAITGGDGSKITTDDGSTFTYNNSYGGYWWSDPDNPFATNAQVNSWTPPLNQSMKWGQDRIYGYAHHFWVDLFLML